ncbi:a-pheromone processing metallopeptidase Ste23 [Coemansia reversa NRRL 1564]|uniref:A-pheromone processing metallopeptidase Ste23 n=1 Tax=Coemansia reversa (strain ATCC 12441 / NRRL 1564) TaxID=763665 RepID=A0A2G5BB24_COERN|nr:a-pheromone processing metallopeptidase Ste23 [Coemansia reversa NRRL 1564]|eukprot:PIA15917.1 a-pheromone processing metallopeptidase Ste23 [Coemansia reversa NRRL 1564]
MPYTEYVGDLNKSPSDSRDYRLIRLPNGLVAMVVHNPDESKACAALDVNVGSLADPPEFQGLAHFCEHLLFMGTEKYPKENEYNEYLSAHGGYANAYTDLEDTCYYFELTYDALEGALDRFSQFFISPLFTADCTDREVRAVDSEHKKNIQSDMWRQYQLEKELSSPNHPFSMFATGNYDTLAGAARRLGVDLRSRLLEFHARYYSADIMRLVVVGRDSLDQLAEWVVDKFSHIKSKGLTKPLFEGHPLTSSEMGKLIWLKSVRQQRSLDMTFALPDVKPYYRTKPTQYLGSLLGHEGRGSVLACLKKRGWATGIVAGRSPTSAEGFDMFKVTVNLTESGLEHYADVVRAVFAYIQLLLTKGPQQWHQEELLRISEIEYQFMEKTGAVSLASTLANTMQNRYLPPDHLLSDGVLLTGFDKELLSWVQGFLVADNVRIMLASHDADGNFDRTEKHYGIEYRLDTIPSVLMRDMYQPPTFAELFLPAVNEFIPADLGVKNTRRDAEPVVAPTLLRRTESLELWFKQDDRFFLPRGDVRIQIETPVAYESALNSVLTSVFLQMLKDTLTELTYDAEVAGLWFEVRDNVEGIQVHVDGFNDKLLRLLQIVMETLRGYQVEQAQFEVYKREVKKRLDNARHMEPYSHAQSSTSFLNQSVMWRYTDKLAEFEMVTRERLQQFISTLFEQTRLLMLVTGNFEEADALAAGEMGLAALGSRALPDYARRVPRALLHGAGQFVRQARVPDPENVNSCVDVSIYAGQTADARERVLLNLTSLVLQEPFFDQLRTKEQLGYITYSTDRKYNGGQMALRLVIQSEVSPAFVALRIARFVREFHKRLAQMTQDKFESFVNSLRVMLEEKLKNLSEESGLLWQHISSGYYEFDKIARDLKTLAELCKADLVAFWDRYGNPATAAEHTSLVHLTQLPDVVIALHGSLEHEGVRSLALKDVAAFVRTLEGAATVDVDAMLDQLVALVLASAEDPEDESLVQAIAKMRKSASYVRTALAMVGEWTGGSSDSDSNGKVANGIESSGRDSLCNIGAVKTLDGAWMFRDEALFRATLRQSGAPVPMRKLVPKYT